MSVRVYQLAKQLGLDNKTVIEALKKRGLAVDGPSNAISNIDAEAFIHDHEAQLETALPAPEIPRTGTLPSSSVSRPIVFVKSAEEVMEEKRLAREQRRALVVPPPQKVLSNVRFTGNAPQLPPSQTTPLPSAPEVEELVTEVKMKTSVVVKPPIVVRELSSILNVKPFRLISELMHMGIFASMNQVIDENLAQQIAEKYGVELVLKHRLQNTPPPKVELSEAEKEEEEKKLLRPRPPVVCILGHVDHGKTTLLDYIRRSNVAAKEVGGITQHIGAYQITYNGKNITFLDTPGHAAFSKMRQRGTLVTDIAVLVVAADDGFMPQTEEALGFAQRENLPVIVAINKIDAKGANVDRVKQQMQKRGISSEDWGGETLCVGLSALKGTNVDELLGAILLQADMMELKANDSCAAEGVVVESQMEVGKGATTTIVVLKGTLKVGDSVACDHCYCKVRAIVDASGCSIGKAGPSTPAKIVGWTDVPHAGARFKAFQDDREAKQLVEDNVRDRRTTSSSTDNSRVSTKQDLLAAITTAKQNVLRTVVKADVHGSAEAVVDCLKAIKSTKIALEVVSQQVGCINKNDVQAAHAAGAVIVGFNTRLENGVAPLAKHYGITIIQHNIIYELVDKVKDAMADLLEPEWVENRLGSAEVRQLFQLSKGAVAGCMVIGGRIMRDASVRVRRKQEVVFEGKIQMLKRFKDDVTEVKSGYECGLQLMGHFACEVGDVVECFEVVAQKPSLQ
jgi:translation initiation factor IF-2